MNKKTIWSVVIIVLLIVLVWGVSRDSKKVSGEPIKIGAVLSLSGSAAFWAEFGKNAADMAVKEINDDGGVNGRPLEIVYEDGQTSPIRAVSAFKKLAAVDHVDVLMGDVWAFLTNPMINLADQEKKVLISPTVMNASVGTDSSYFFTLGHTTESIQPAVQTFFNKNPQVKTVAILCVNDPWGIGMTKSFEDVIGRNNKNVVGKNCVNDFGADFRTEAAKTKAVNPDAILISSPGTDRAVKALKDIGVKSLIVTDSNLIDGFENRESVSLEQLENVFVIDWQANSEFVKKYQKLYGRYPILEAQNSYEVIRSIAKALENNPTDLMAGLKTVKYESVDGYIDFTTGTNINPNKANAKLYKILGHGLYEEVK